MAGDGESEIRQVFEASDFSFSEDLFSMDVAWLWAGDGSSVWNTWAKWSVRRYLRLAPLSYCCAWPIVEAAAVSAVRS